MTISAWLSELLPSVLPAPTPGPLTLAGRGAAPSTHPRLRGSACPLEEARLHAMADVEQWEVEPESGPVTSRGASVAEMRGLLIEEEE